MLASREFEYSDRDISLLQELVLRHTGICLPGHKQDLLYGRLSRRLRALQLENFHDYCDLLDKGNGDEIEHFINAITTNLTAFFRENHHFERLAREIIPLHLERNAQTRQLRIWSAGCSSGEEPYSIAITLREAIPDIDNWDVKILATDLDSNVLEKAVAGIYHENRIAGLSQERLKKWFQKGGDSHRHMVRVVQDVRKLVSFHHLNLFDEWPMHGPFDIIFCRNVAIYFDKPARSALFERFANILASGGHLYIGHSESLRQVSTHFKQLGNTIYEKDN